MYGMRAELKDLFSPDHPDGLDSYAPSDPTDFSVFVQAIIGPADSEGEESFAFRVMSPKALAAEAESAPKGFEFIRHRLVVNRWDPELIARAIRDLASRTEGEDWTAIAQSLSRFGMWEFEGYRR